MFHQRSWLYLWIYSNLYSCSIIRSSILHSYIRSKVDKDRWLYSYLPTIWEIVYRILLCCPLLTFISILLTWIQYYTSTNIIIISIVFISALMYVCIPIFIPSILSSISYSISLLSDHYECGFYPSLISMIKYRINYWIPTIHSPTSEQESISVLLYCLSQKNENILLGGLLGILFIDPIVHSV